MRVLTIGYRKTTAATSTSLIYYLLKFGYHTGIEFFRVLDRTSALSIVEIFLLSLQMYTFFLCK